MAGLARLVIPGLPHHVTQRGNRRQQTFFNDGDYAAYVELMADWCREEGVEIWGYCLMPNHVHLIAVPAAEESLRRAIGEAHRRYTRRINFREKWRGYLWQGRFASFVMDEPYVVAAARYVELNPVRAGLVADAAEWPWSSARPHLKGRDDRLVKTAPLLAMIADWGFKKVSGTVVRSTLRAVPATVPDTFLNPVEICRRRRGLGQWSSVSLTPGRWWPRSLSRLSRAARGPPPADLPGAWSLGS